MSLRTLWAARRQANGRSPLCFVGSRPITRAELVELASEDAIASRLGCSRQWIRIVVLESWNLRWVIGPGMGVLYEAVDTSFPVTCSRDALDAVLTKEFEAVAIRMRKRGLL